MCLTRELRIVLELAVFLYPGMNRRTATIRLFTSDALMPATKSEKFTVDKRLWWMNGLSVGHTSGRVV